MAGERESSQDDPHLEVKRITTDLQPTDNKKQIYTLIVKSKTRKKAYEMFKKSCERVFRFYQVKDKIWDNGEGVEPKLRSRHLSR